jgi:hypothetical protein
LILNIQSVNQNGALALSAVIGGTNSGKVFFSILAQIIRQEDVEPVK